MTPDELKKAGEALYGPRWQTDIANLLGVDSRRVRAWVASERPIPLGVRFELIKELRKRAKHSIEVATYLAKNVPDEIDRE